MVADEFRGSDWGLFSLAALKAGPVQVAFAVQGVLPSLEKNRSPPVLGPVERGGIFS